MGGKMPTKVMVTSHNNFGNKNFLSNITLKYQSGFFCKYKSWLVLTNKIVRILLAGNRKIIEFDDNESDKKIRIYNKGIEYNTKMLINGFIEQVLLRCQILFIMKA